ncbi:MAG: alpha-2-macroglobulin, partial [Planctomycetaceae bacterium]|nr:alpha-2-macroglobulin [Planctomycetaceae bacterium]
MNRPLPIRLMACAIVLIPGLWYAMAAEPTSLTDLRAAAKKNLDAGNFRDAMEQYQRLVQGSENGGQSLGNDLEQAWQCLNRLQRQNEQDELLASAIKAHPNDPHVYWKAATLLGQSVHYGFVVAGEFQRGNQRGGGEYVQSMERDRVQALGWMQTAIPLAEEHLAGGELANFWQSFAHMLLMHRDGQQAWQLQQLTNVNELPDYEQGYHWRGGSSGKGAAVDAEGNPVYHSVPTSFAEATSDGQRWRYCLEHAALADTGRRPSIDLQFAQFLQGQFGVQTLQQWGIVLPRVDDADSEEHDAATSIVSLKTLSDNETIARLANGVKRFTLPDEFNYILIYQRLAAQGSAVEDNAQQQLAGIYENRQQYEQAAKWRRTNLDRFGKNDGGWRKQRLDQIVKNWGQFEPVMTQPAGAGATVEYRFRNGSEVKFEAHAIKIPQLLEDVKAYLKSNPQQLNWQQLQIDNIGYRIVQENAEKYLGAKVADWSLELKPRPGHYDRRITVNTPLQTAGAYLVTAKMQDGNVSRIILWLDDTAITKKQLNNQGMYYIADSVSGKPIEHANVEFFGWRNERVPNTKRDFRTITRNFAEFTDENGMVFLDPKRQEQNFQWLVIARTEQGRFAHLGFSGVWYGRYQRQDFQQQKIYTVTDRPVYRPDQKVQFKFWAVTAKYDAKEQSPWAGKKFEVRIHDPQGTEVLKQTLTADEYGGFSSEFSLPEDAKLGVYSLNATLPNVLSGGGNFRVEEYKKPEFEVTIDAPTEPVKLGDQVTATIRAKYYFGAPVQNAKVSFKVERSSHETRWYPAMPWDWLYGDGYWWYAADYDWYPGFRHWGCIAPRPHWIHWNPEPPELVLDQEVEIGEDGTVEVQIDTALAKALHGDQDHEYKITAEVTDASRRTIVG